MALIQVISWLVVGGIAAWLLVTLAGRGPLGYALDYVVGWVGALLGGFLFAPAIAYLWAIAAGGAGEGDPAQPLSFGRDAGWWITVPVAFLSALGLSYIYRLALRARTSP
jgi:uncharacterized membrane protein YeaQ/YmgE (transglycosylase-associated protein family)